MRPLLVISLFCVNACVAPGARQAAPASYCAAAAFPDDPQIGPAFTDRYNGSYWNNSEQVTVWREGQRLYIGASPHTRVQLKRAPQLQEANAFSDGCGSSYAFILPPDGAGGYVIITEENGARNQWHRRVTHAD